MKPATLPQDGPLSAAPPHHRAASLGDAGTGNGPAPGSGPRILLVDDDPTVRDSLENVLVAEGFTVIAAENGQQALEFARRHPIDLALLDLNMPVKNGWETFECLSIEHPRIAVIIATARPNQLFTAIAAGAGALLEKPMDISTLLRTIRMLLAESPGSREARLAGRATEFHYCAGRCDRESP